MWFCFKLAGQVRMARVKMDGPADSSGEKPTAATHTGRCAGPNNLVVV
jgi:hypothetical protein